MKILVERVGGANKVTGEFESVEELIKSAVNGFVNIGEDEYVNLSQVSALNVVEKRPENESAL